MPDSPRRGICWRQVVAQLFHQKVRATQETRCRRRQGLRERRSESLWPHRSCISTSSVYSPLQRSIRHRSSLMRSTGSYHPLACHAFWKSGNCAHRRLARRPGAASILTCTVIQRRGAHHGAQFLWTIPHIAAALASMSSPIAKTIGLSRVQEFVLPRLTRVHRADTLTVTCTRAATERTSLDCVLVNFNVSFILQDVRIISIQHSAYRYILISLAFR